MSWMNEFEKGIEQYLRGDDSDSRTEGNIVIVGKTLSGSRHFKYVQSVIV